MQVAPLTRYSSEPVARKSAAAGLQLLDTLSAAATPLGAAVAPGDFDSQIERRVRSDDRNERQAAETVAPTRSADVAMEAERGVETGSRAFRRQVSREQGAEQFREGRSTFRDAMNDASKAGRTQANTQNAIQAQAQQQASTSKSEASAAEAKPAQAGNTPTDATKPTTPTATPATSNTTAQQPAAGQPTPPAAANAAATNVASAGTTKADAIQPVQASAQVTAAVARATAAAAKPASVTQVRSAGQTELAQTRGESKSKATSPRVAAAKTAEKQPAESADRSANIDRIARIIRSRLDGDRANMVMRLDPPELGKIRLEMNLNRDAMTVKIETHTALAHRLLTEQAHTLREGLEAAGIQMERLEIRPPETGSNGSVPDFSQQADSQHAEHDGSADPNTDRSGTVGTDSSPPVDSPESELHAALSELVTESRVNVLA